MGSFGLMKSALCLAVCCVFVMGCSSSRYGRGDSGRSREDVVDAIKNQAIKTGMTKAEVRQAWGDPADVAPGDAEGSEIWKYDRREAAAGAATGGSPAAVVERAIYTLRFEGNVLKAIESKPY